MKNNSKDSVNCKRFWLVDYPILCYLNDCDFQNKIIMAHLADPKAKQIVFDLDQSYEFISFVDHFSDAKDAKISYLVFEKESNKLYFKTHTYRNPFMKREFTNKKVIING